MSDVVVLALDYLLHNAAESGTDELLRDLIAEVRALRAERDALRELIKEALELLEWTYKARVPQWDGTASSESTIGKLRAALQRRSGT